MVAERLFGMSSNLLDLVFVAATSAYRNDHFADTKGNSLTILSMGSLLEGFPKIRPGGIPGTNLGKRLLVLVKQ